MAVDTAYIPKAVQTGNADVDTIAAWLESNEHQPLDMLRTALHDLGYSKSRIMGAFIVYVDKRVH